MTDRDALIADIRDNQVDDPPGTPVYVLMAPLVEQIIAALSTPPPAPTEAARTRSDCGEYCSTATWCDRFGVCCAETNAAEYLAATPPPADLVALVRRQTELLGQCEAFIAEQFDTDDGDSVALSNSIHAIRKTLESALLAAPLGAPPAPRSPADGRRGVRARVRHVDEHHLEGQHARRKGGEVPGRCAGVRVGAPHHGLSAARPGGREMTTRSYRPCCGGDHRTCDCGPASEPHDLETMRDDELIAGVVASGRDPAVVAAETRALLLRVVEQHKAKRKDAR